MPSTPVNISLAQKLNSLDPTFWNDIRTCTTEATSLAELLRLSTMRRRAERKNLVRPTSEATTCCRIVLLGGYTTYPLSELVTHFLATTVPAIDANIVLGEFDNYVSEIMAPGGLLDSPQPDAIVILPAVSRCKYSGELLDTSDAQKSAASLIAQNILSLAQTANKRTGSRIIVSNFALAPGHDPGAFRVRNMGTDWSFRKLVNLEMGLNAPDYVTICDLEFLSARIGTRKVTDDRSWFESKQLGSSEFLIEVAREIAHLIAAPFREPKKVIVLDLDNTLWGGVIGDDGVEGIAIGGTDAEGEAYRAFQEHVLELKRRGFLLAVASKNDHDKAIAPFQTHPEMAIRANDIVSFHANWGPKPDSIREISRELGLGLNSFVFIDDNPAEIELVRQILPEVSCILLKEDASLRRVQLQDSSLFEVSSLTQEDTQRSLLYQTAAQRQQLQLSAASYEDYLESLLMVGEIFPFRPPDILRISQLIARSNQFNLTTIRYQVPDLNRMMEDQNVEAFSIRLRDRFGDHGLISVVICNIVQAELIVDSWLMSCRVLKRQVEEIVFNELLRIARVRQLTHIRGIYLPTPKNGMVRDIYEKLGFECILEGSDRREFIIEVAGKDAFGTHISIEDSRNSNGEKVDSQ